MVFRLQSTLRHFDLFSEKVVIRSTLKWNENKSENSTIWRNASIKWVEIFSLFSPLSKFFDDIIPLVKEKLNEDADCEIATTTVNVSLVCPLGKMKMKTPCR